MNQNVVSNLNAIRYRIVNERVKGQTLGHIHTIRTRTRQNTIKFPVSYTQLKPGPFQIIDSNKIHDNIYE